MLPSRTSVRFARFGVFEADFQVGELRKAGIRIKLHEQSFQILAILLEHPGELVSRVDLSKQLWPGDTFVDFDHGLNNAVNRLRDALCDSVESPRWIETLPRRGYRFIGAVECGDSTSASSIAKAQGEKVDPQDTVIHAEGVQSTEQLSHKSYRWLLWTFPAAALLALLTVAVLPKPRVIPSSRSFVLPPTGATFDLAGDVGGPVALSADGTKLAFVAVDAKGSAFIWVRPLGKLSAEQLDGTKGATFPFWSPDGRFIGFFEDGKLKKIDIAGGPAVTLCDAESGRGGSWGQKGSIIFTPSTHSGIYEIPDSGGTPIAITSVDATIHTTHRWPKFLPDGRHFIYLAASHFRDASHNGVYWNSLDGKENHLIVSTDADATFASGYLFYMRKNRLVAQTFDARRGELKGTAWPTVERVLYDPSIWKAVFDVSPGGAMAYQLGDTVTGMQLCWYDRSGGKIGVLGEPAFQWEPRLSPDGRRLAAGVADGGYGHIWASDLERGGRVQVTYGRYNTGSAVWTPDGAQLIFAGKRQHYSLYQVESNGAAPEHLLLDTGSDTWALDLSRNGRFLLFGQGIMIGRGKSVLWVYPIRGSRVPFRLLEGDARESDGQFSPDGRWVAYASNQSGRNEVYAVPFRPQSSSQQRVAPVGKERVQISFSGGHLPRWRRDGKELFYAAGDNTLMAVPVSSIGSKLKIGAAHPLFPGNPNGMEFSYDVSPDGNRFIITTPAAEKDAFITLVENWPSDFRK